jgi:hypothetical protein
MKCSPQCSRLSLNLFRNPRTVLGLSSDILIGNTAHSTNSPTLGPVLTLHIPVLLEPALVEQLICGNPPLVRLFEKRGVQSHHFVAFIHLGCYYKLKICRVALHCQQVAQVQQTNNHAYYVWWMVSESCRPRMKYA